MAPQAAAACATCHNPNCNSVSAVFAPARLSPSPQNAQKSPAGVHGTPRAHRRCAASGPEWGGAGHNRGFARSSSSWGAGGSRWEERRSWVQRELARSRHPRVLPPPPTHRLRPPAPPLHSTTPTPPTMEPGSHIDVPLLLDANDPELNSWGVCPHGWCSGQDKMKMVNQDDCCCCEVGARGVGVNPEPYTNTTRLGDHPPPLPISVNACIPPPLPPLLGGLPP